MTNATTVVVTEVEALDTAYSMGYDEFDPVPEVGVDEPVDLRFFTDSARFTNTVAPKLRAVSGFGDAGHGTFQQDREVCVIPVGAEDDEPARCEVVDAQVFYDEAVQPAWHTGAVDALEGRDRGASVDRESRLELDD